MGTRADFYAGRGEHAEWLGSVAYDGYPDGLTDMLSDIDTEATWRARVARELAGRDDATRPEQGWPWPWDDSSTTDYAFAWDGDRVWVSCYGSAWVDLADVRLLNDDLPETETVSIPKTAVFPNMAARAAVAEPGTKRSGVLVFVAPRDPT
jgi:hypothetical protein